MKVLIDALGAPDNSGGMELYASEVVLGWAELFPEDELHVVGPSWTSSLLVDYERVTVHSWSSTGVLARSFGQIVLSGLLARAVRADALLSLSPIVSPLYSHRRRACVVHDWRHVTNPNEFGAAQKAYRQVWRYSVRHAGRVIAVSDKTAAETLRVVSSAPTTVVLSGGDHPRRWKSSLPTPLKRELPRRVVTFGHHNNKRPELVIDAMQLLPELLQESTELTVLGASGQYRDALMQRAKSTNNWPRFRFPGYVTTSEYQDIMRAADLVVLASSDEGFGLPIAEANWFGVPRILTADSRVAHLHEGAIVCDPAPAAIAMHIAEALRPATRQASIGPIRTWAETVADLRSVLQTCVVEGVSA